MKSRFHRINLSGRMFIKDAATWGATFWQDFVLVRIFVRFRANKQPIKPISQLIFGILILFLVVGLIGCNEPDTGCLDIRATNYDVTADEHCCTAATECCCTYPQLRLSVQHRLKVGSDTNFSFSEAHTVTPDSSHFFYVDDLRFYLSNIRLFSPTGRQLLVENTLQIQAIDEDGNLIDASVTDDIVLVRRTVFDYTVGSIEDSLTIDSVSFDIGINEPLNHVLLETVPADHILASTGVDSLYVSLEEGFVFNKIVLRRDTFSETNPITLKINNLSSVGLSFSTPTTIPTGSNVTIKLKINYLEWFKGINFVVDSVADIEEKIWQNTTNVFELAD